MRTINNSVKLIGNLGTDVQLVEFKSGSKKAEVALATNESYKNAKGEFEEITQWHRIIAWGRVAEFMTKSLSKGAKVAISGNIKYRSYENKEGVTKYITEIVANEFLKVGDVIKGKGGAAKMVTA